MILPPLAPALLLFGQPGHGQGITSVAPGRAATSLSMPDSPKAMLVDAASASDGPDRSDARSPALEALLPAVSISKASPRSQPPPFAKHARHAAGDPLEGFNRKMFAVQDGLDRAIIRPAAIGYRHVVPKPMRGGLRHFLSNLTEPIVFLNYLLQLKPGKAAETLVRFTVNSTIGVAGMLDVAKLPSIGLPHRPNGFGNTLGFYGVKPGPYLFLPLFGPSDLRDFVGGQADSLTIPVLVAGKPFNQPAYLIPSAVIGGLDQREQNDDDLRALYAGAVDPYASLRSVYLQNRMAEIQALHHHLRQGGDVLPIDDALDDPDQNSGHTVDPPESGKAVVPPPGNVDAIVEALPNGKERGWKVDPDPGASELQDPMIDPATTPKP